MTVNMVLATDIFDKDLNQLRTDRWQRAFHENLPDSVTKDLRATIVMEHIIQASDVAHTMQHWHIYQKWNRRLFEEMYTAYKAGRLSSDPRAFWYKGELAFFDNYVIPLATKLKECNVFGVSSDEYLAYAMKNREEWEERGEEIVTSMMAEVKES
jgi:3'5'-cyclic nucleotide phosphodiesterase